MQKLPLLISLILVFSTYISAQKTQDFSGFWLFDKAVSLPNEKLTTKTFRTYIKQTPAGVQTGTISGDNLLVNDDAAVKAAISYPFDKETMIEAESSNGKMPLKVKAELTKKGQLITNGLLTVKRANEEVSVKIKETFEMSSDGNSLKVYREVQTSGEFPKIELYLARKQSSETILNNNTADAKPLLSQGVLNGKAKHIEPPMGAGIKGIVPVTVIFDEEGKVVFAQVIRGDPLLKKLAVESAMKCTFEPVQLNGKSIKVSGIILYNFR